MSAGAYLYGPKLLVNMSPQTKAFGGILFLKRGRNNGD